ncbi:MULTISPECIES: hypothetical protein [Pseudomonas]|uniref:hypothetical protein n=1 Tax=Pseudomonas TaxID=286 RepID=UPI000760C864|nr:MULTISPECIES: hypothetical protein [Pseudomonas]WLP03972.1 hypothetical protein Q8015_18910 [Pseudomonas putida]
MSKVSTLIVTGKKEPRQKMWEAMRLLRPGFTVNDIVRRTAGRSADVSRYIQALTKAGVVKLVETPEGATTSRGKVFALIRDEGADHPRLNKNGERTFEHLATENIWRTLRILGGHLTVQDIAKTASAGGVSVSVVKTRQYLNALADAGYVEKIENAPQNFETFCLVGSKYSGPRPPEIRKLDNLQVYDPNLNKLVFTKTIGSFGADRSLVEPGVALLRTRDLLSEWLDLARGGKTVQPSTDLVQRTQLELASTGESGGLQ